MIINPTTSVWSSMELHSSIERLEGLVDPLIGSIAGNIIQICPQHPGVLREFQLQHIRDSFSAYNFILHSDIRVPGKCGTTLDLSDVSPDNKDYWLYIKKLNDIVGGQRYTLHAGRRTCSWNSLLDKYNMLCDWLGITVAVEGHYPYRNSYFFLDSWSEHELAYEEDLNLVIDLSHFNIVAKRQGWQDSLLRDFLKSDQTKEIHISFNDGTKDQHLVGSDIYRELWIYWKTLLEQSTVDIFYECNHSRENFDYKK